MKKKSIALLLTTLSGLAHAQHQAPPLPDPWLPPAARSAPLAAPTEGPALRAQVLAKLELQFQAADAGRRGALSLEEARRAGWGFAVQNFGALDADGRGEIRVQDLRRFVEKQAQIR